MVYDLFSELLWAPCKHKYTSVFATSCQAALKLSIKEAAHLYQLPDHSVISLRLLYLFVERYSKLNLLCPSKSMKACTV